jgi:hypothetical protein
MTLSRAEKSQCVEWFIEAGKSIVAFQRKFRQQHGVNSRPPDKKQIKLWYAKFKSGECMARKKKACNKVSHF